MQLTQSLAHTIESVYRGFDYEQPLRCRLDLAFPAIYQINLGSDVDAGCQLPVNQRMRDAPGFFERTASRKNEPFVGHIKSVVSNRRFAFHSKHTRQPMATQIKFGTSGWRAVMAEEFTFANANRAVHGIARYVASQQSNGAKVKVIVGRDPRFLGESFCSAAAGILSSYGITPLVIAEPAPTPTISYAVIQSKGDGAIHFTASHNPPEYNGIKYSTPDGAPALPEATRQIEAAAEKLASGGGGGIPSPAAENFETVDVRPSFLKRLAELVDLKAIAKSGIKVVYDPFWGAGRGYSSDLLREAGVAVETVHDYRDVLFGGHAPEPSGELLGDARAKMREMGADLGIATDGDADRFGIVDADGTFIQPNYIIALLFDYLVETRGWKNGVAKSVATTNLINALADYHKVPLYETPVGFKYIGELIIADKIAIGGEESAGLTIRGHVPEKDGVIAGLLVAEMVASRGKSLGAQLKAMFGKVGSFYPVRENFRLTPEVKAAFTEKLKTDPTELSGRKVVKIVRTDGLKLILEDGSWVCYRPSGPEPVVRAYTEARSEQDMEALKAAAEKFVLS